jgi:2-phosphoglycolate phosphatase
VACVSRNKKLHPVSLYKEQKMEQSRSASLTCPRAVVFDFDGTLADSYAAITASVNHVRAGHDLPPLPEAEVRKHVGRGASYLIEHTIGTGDVEADLARYREHHPSVMLSGTRLLPGAREAISALKSTGRQLGLCSNKPLPFSLAILAHFGLREMFDVILGPEDVPRPKPAPDMLTLALHKLKVAPADALYIGDMSVDIQTARAAGVPVWVVPTGSESEAALRQAAPDRLLRDLSELLELFTFA